MARDCSVMSIITQNFLALTKVDLLLEVISRLLSLLRVSLICLVALSGKNRVKEGSSLRQVFVSVRLT